ncbi:hypothetical protein F8388_004239 [Cannabis sativa]|uniref:RNase H type-1 domain-containing protein n=1 Tax=Cannabis sativa TaxID=3483 RepID=A0A7J6F7E1_CANSA|nr:hypothetical protein F8388_004239 [Cannabis sativa]
MLSQQASCVGCGFDPLQRRRIFLRQTLYACLPLSRFPMLFFIVPELRPSGINLLLNNSLLTIVGWISEIFTSIALYHFPKLNFPYLLKSLANLEHQKCSLFFKDKICSDSLPAVLNQILLPSTTALFVDAALSFNTPATGLGMVFMQGMSHIQHSARIHKPGASSPLFAEAQALAEGLQWCLSSNLAPAYIFSDCLNLVSKVNGNWHDHSPLSTLVHKIRTFLSRFPEASLLHVSRQHNDKAHSLAKQALRLRDED